MGKLGHSVSLVVEKPVAVNFSMQGMFFYVCLIFTCLIEQIKLKCINNMFEFQCFWCVRMNWVNLLVKSKWAKCQVLSRHRHISTISVIHIISYNCTVPRWNLLNLAIFSTTGRTEWSQVPVDASMFPQWFDGESHRGSGAGLCCSGPWFVARMSGGPIKWSAGLYLLDCRATTISNPDRS